VSPVRYLPYIVALGITGATLTLKLALGPLVESHTQLYLSAVIVAAWWGGTMPGLVSTAASLVFIWYSAPSVSALVEPPTAVRLLLFGGQAAIVSALIGSLRTARRRAEASTRAAAREVAERRRLDAEREHLAQQLKERADELIAVNRTKDEFLATLSHELRTPLNVMLGWVWRLRHTTLSPEAQERALDTIERNTRLQARLIDDLLDLSRVIRGQFKVDPKPIALADLIQATLEAVAPAAEAKGVGLRANLNSPDDRVMGDAGRLQQVLWNLLSNAVKFTDPGGLVDVSLRRGNGAVHIIVKDTGQGIPPDFLPHVFERFRQGDGSMTRRYGGLGLGLAITRHLVELHGGSVRAESEGEGRGSTFTVSLPIPAVLESGTTPAASPSEPALDVDLSGITVLVVEDDTDARTLVATLLGDYGARVTAVGTVRDAMASLTRERPDVILTDLKLPGEDGYALLEHVRRLTPGAPVPTATLTALTGDDNRLAALSAGFELFLAKPVDATHLVRAVATLARRTTVRERAAAIVLPIDTEQIA
jgi:signal transduction histidine kinase/CheY-like chemotaxis protein